MKKVLGLIAASMLLAAPAMAAQEVPQATAPAYNCDYMPSCEVAPGIYGSMSSPVMSKFNLSIGGFVKLDYAYNSVNLGVNGGLLPNGPIAKTNSVAGGQEQSILTARQSRFWLKVNGPTFLGAKTGAIIEADFYGDQQAAGESPALRMRLANATLDWPNTQILFGQAYDIFGPAISSTQDFRSGAATGTPNNPRVPQLRLTQKIPFNSDNSLKIVAGIQDPAQMGNGGGSAFDATAYSAKPNVAGQVMFLSNALGKSPGYFGMSMNPLTIGMFGLYGGEQTTTSSQIIDSYGYGLYAFVPVLSSKDGKNRAMTMSLEAQAYMAANMKFNAATGNLTNGAGNTTAPAKGYGLWGQLMFYPTQDLGLTAGYGRRNAYNYASYPAATAASTVELTNELIYGNATYDLNAAVRVGVEYEHQKTLYKATLGNDLGQDNTIRAVAYYFF